jgi:hypothetical protein
VTALPRPTWSTHEAWLTGFLEPLSDDVLQTPLAMCFTGERADWLLDGRHQRHDDDVSPPTELAVIVAELAPDAAVVATPTRVRDLDAPDVAVVARTWALTSVVRRPDGEGYDLRTRLLPVGGVGSASEMEVEQGPVASVLDDAIRNRLGVAPEHALVAAVSWGNELYVPGGDRDPAAASQVTLEASTAAEVRAAGVARHRLRRHACELEARHLPTAGWPQPLRRPAVHASTPDGWQTACPV